MMDTREKWQRLVGGRSMPDIVWQVADLESELALAKLRAGQLKAELDIAERAMLKQLEADFTTDELLDAGF